MLICSRDDSGVTPFYALWIALQIFCLAVSIYSAV